MKTIGLIGGMSWESSLEYYRLINETVKMRLGGFHSARSVLVSVDFAEIEILQREERWADAGRSLILAARAVERAGADFVVMCTNTMHVVADDIQARIRIPLLHIADPTAGAIAARGLKRIGLLGTRYTMEKDFYRGRLEKKHGLNILVPNLEERAVIHRVIYEELVMGRIEDSSRRAFLSIVERLVASGAEGIILGCTEIGLLLEERDSPVPVFDTTRIHALAAVELALER